MTPQQLQSEARSIADEMAHRFSMGSVRAFAFVMVKIFKALFNRLYVNKDGIQQVCLCLHLYHCEILN